MRASLWTKFNFWALVEFGRIWALDGDLLPLEPPFDDYLTSHIPALDEGDSPALAAMREAGASSLRQLRDSGVAEWAAKPFTG